LLLDRERPAIDDSMGGAKLHFLYQELYKDVAGGLYINGHQGRVCVKGQGATSGHRRKNRANPQGISILEGTSFRTGTDFEETIGKQGRTSKKLKLIVNQQRTLQWTGWVIIYEIYRDLAKENLNGEPQTTEVEEMPTGWRFQSRRPPH
jgi:hypothetical protein